MMQTWGTDVDGTFSSALEQLQPDTVSDTTADSK